MKAIALKEKPAPHRCKMDLFTFELRNCMEEFTDG